jgi:hypothetical protein
VRALLTCLMLAAIASAANAEEKQALPDWSGWWNYGQALPTEYVQQPPPMKPESIERIREARAKDLDPDKNRYCRPPDFVGFSGGFIDAVEFLFTPGRVTLTNEGGLIRRIYTDGRPVPQDVEDTNTGTSVGHWEGDTLVVETVGINPKARFPQRGPGSLQIGKNAHITERIHLKDSDTLEFDVTVMAPEVLIAPDHRTRLLKRSRKQSAREISFCVDYDRSFDQTTGKQRFDMTPPADLPPPPQPPK